MNRLTENMVIAKAKISDLSKIQKLDFYGSGLNDVSIIKKMTGVEVLSLNGNCISTLSPFKECTRLHELCLRANKIKDIYELVHLQGLSNLKYLWLEGNPLRETCGPKYRSIVLSLLPQLKKLDNIEVTRDDMEQVKRLPDGSFAHISEETFDNRTEGDGQSQIRGGPQQTALRDDPSENNSRSTDACEGDNARTLDVSQCHTTNQNKNTVSMPSDELETDTDLSMTQGHSTSTTFTTSADQIHFNPIENDSFDDFSSRAPRASSFGSVSSLQSCPAAYDHNPERDTQRVASLREGHRNTHAAQDGDEFHTARRMRNPCGDSVPNMCTSVLNHPPFHRRSPVSRSSNLLSAALCLTKELDYGSLEVLEHAVTSRLEDLSNE